jgi:hypothetical protein
MTIICANCQEREGTIPWSGSMDSVSIARLGGAKALPIWFEVCALREQIAFAKAQAEKLPTMEARLSELLKEPS